MKRLAMAAAALAISPTIWAAAFQNGDFESFNTGIANALCPPAFGGAVGCAQFNAGNTGITGWTIGGNSVDIVGSLLWNAASGSNSLDLAGTDNGSISQTFDTIAGQIYRVDFALGGNPFGTPTVKTGTVSDGLESKNLSFDIGSVLPVPPIPGAVSWTPEYFYFTGHAGGSTTLTFTNTSGGGAGLALDSITVTAVPEPQAVALALAGLGFLGFAARRRRV